VRSRPLVRLLVERQPIEPGSKVTLDVLLTSRSETPTEHVDVVLTAEEAVAIPQGKSYLARQAPVMPPQRVRWNPGTLTPGEHRQRVRLDIPPNVPPSYKLASGWCRVSYTVEVHVVIPYWIDRHAHFGLEVAPIARAPRSGSHTLVATHENGPKPKAVYIEASLEATELTLGEPIGGEVTFANVGTRRIRRVTVSLVATEHTRQPTPAMHVVARYAALLVSGPPPEGESFPFRVAMPAKVPPSFDGQLFSLRWHVEIRADVVLGADAVLNIPIQIVRLPSGVEAPPRSRRAVPVGRARLARMWAIVAQRIPTMSFDEADGTMLSARGAVSLTLAREAYEGTLGTVARYRFPHLGLDVHLAPRAMLDALARGRWEHRHADRFTVTGRESAQLDAFFDDQLLGHLAGATTAQLDDDGAEVRIAGAASSASALEQVARSALALLERFDAAIARIPPPAAVASLLPAWKDFAARMTGRLELGRLWVHDATHEGFRFELGTVWEPRATIPTGTIVRVPIEPPLETALSIEDPSLSAAAREQLRALAGSPDFHMSESELVVFTHDTVADPITMLPEVAALTSVLRAVRGTVATGPFR
jgi:hypothetical protein